MGNDSVTVSEHEPLPSQTRSSLVSGALRETANLLRIRQWPKNTLIFVPLVLSPGAGLFALVESTILCGGFCLLSSTVYIINDAADAESDRTHPSKKNRPIASGAISVPTALFIMISLLIMVAVLASMLPGMAILFMVTYLSINLAYSFILKKIPILEIFCVAIGFVIRVLVGTEVAGLAVSYEVMLFVLFFCTFISVGKRRKEITIDQASMADSPHRIVLKHYSLPFLDSLLSATMAISGIFLWIHVTNLSRTATGSGALLICLSALCLTALTFRYMQAIYVESTGDNPVGFLMKDPFTLLSSLLAAAFYWLSIASLF